MKKFRTFFGVVEPTGEQVDIEDWRKVIDTTTQHSQGQRETELGGKPFCKTPDGRKVQCKEGKYVDQEALEGTWEIRDHDGNWKPLRVSLTR